METKTQLSSLFHKYINFMMTTDDRYLMKGVFQPYEVCGYWRDKQTRNLTITMDGADVSPETRALLTKYWQNVKPELPLCVFKCSGWLVMVMISFDPKTPNMATTVATEDWCAIVEEAARLGVYVKTKSSEKATVIPLTRHKN